MTKEELIELAKDPNTSVDILAELVRERYGLQKIVLANPSTPDVALSDAVESRYSWYILNRKGLDQGSIDLLCGVLRHPKASEVTLKYIWDKIVSTRPWSTRSIGTIVCALVEHPNTPKEILDQIWEKRHEHYEEEWLLDSFAVSKSSTVKLLKKVQY